MYELSAKNDRLNGSGKDELSYPCLRYLNGRLYLTYTENRTNLAFWILEP